MKFTYPWLRDHLDSNAPLDDLLSALTNLGLEVESVHDPKTQLAGFITAHIVKAEPHPDATKLQICTVDAGGEKPLQIVCGAPNARPGLDVALARPGTFIPGSGIVLKPATIRGVASEGMLCSEAELGLPQTQADGILELAGHPTPGTPLAEVLDLGGAVIDVGITPNRSDCLAVRGIARDLAAAGLGLLRPWHQKPIAGTFPSLITLAHTPDLGNACPFFAGRTIRGVRNGPSPEWLQQRLRAIGLRPISALVDITNYITHDLARPLHVFDADRIEGGVLTVRPAQSGETFEALDGKIYALEAGMTVLSDAMGVASLGGIMGGTRTGCSDDTTTVFLEAALWDPKRIAWTGRTLNVSSDARYRFERGVDPTGVLSGIERATQMILDFCGGEVSDVVSFGAPPKTPRTLSVSPQTVQARTGADVTTAQIEAILSALEYTIEATDETGVVTITPPPFRPDIQTPESVISDVIRVLGFDKIPATPLSRQTSLRAPEDARAQRTTLLRRHLAAQGLNEVISWSFVSAALADLFGGVPPALQLTNPISVDLKYMRPSILASLLPLALGNANRGQKNIPLFEIGPVYKGIAPEDQETWATGILAGGTPALWSAPARPFDVFDAKRHALETLAAWGIDPTRVQIRREGLPAWYHPTRGGVLAQGPKNVYGYFGELHPALIQALGLPLGAACFELNLSALPTPKKSARSLYDASNLMPLERDLAFVVPENTPAGDLITAAERVKGVRNVILFDVYQGPHMEAGHKSLAIRFEIEQATKTLTDDEIQTTMGEVIEAITRATGAQLRGTHER